MNERDEFRLPEELELVLAHPLVQPLPDASLLARRAIVLSQDVRATRTERTVLVVGVLVLIAAVARMFESWWSSLRFEFTISNEFILAIWCSMSRLTNETGWLIVGGGVATGVLLFTIGWLRKALSE